MAFLRNQNEKTAQFFSQYSEQYDEKIGKLSLYNQSYIDFISKAKSTKTLLDLACGPANVSSFIKRIVPDIKITCIDLSDKMLDLAESKLITGYYYKSDILNIKIPPEKYDLIVCAFGLPYIKSSEIPKFISELDKFTHQDSLIYISCMQGNKSQYEKMSFSKNEEVLVHYHSKTSVLENFKSYNYKLLDYVEQEFPEHDGSTIVDMIFTFKKEI